MKLYDLTPCETSCSVEAGIALTKHLEETCFKDLSVQITGRFGTVPTAMPAVSIVP
jgi:hypothetical protein